MLVNIFVIAVPALLALLVLLFWIIKAPERGIYTAFFASGILDTVNLGPLREKVGLTEIVILLTWIAMLVNKNWRYVRLPFSERQKVALFALIIFLIVYWASFFINNATYYGFMVGSLIEAFNLTYGALMVLSVVLLIQESNQWKGCLVGWMLGAAIVSLVGLWGLTGSAPAWVMDEFTGRISSTLKFENQIPSYIIPILVITIIWSVSNIIKVRYRIIMLMLIAVMSVTMIGTGSRTAFLLLILSVLALLFILWIQRNNKCLLKGYLGFGIILCGICLLFYTVAALSAYDGDYALGKTPAWQRPVVTLYETIQGNRPLDSTRTVQAEIIIDNIDAAIFLGNGPKLYGGKFNVEEIHNTYAALYFETGIMGFLFMFFFLFSSILCGVRKSDESSLNLLFTAVAVGFILLLLYGLTIYGLRQRTIWLMAGLLISIPSVVSSIENNKS